MELNYGSKIKVNSVITAIVLLSLALSINIYFRLFPAYFPQLKERLKQTVNAKALAEAKREIEASHPDSSPDVKDKLINDFIREYKKKEREKADKEYERIKGRFQDQTGQTYLLETDPFKWKLYVKNVLKYGHPGDKRIGTKSYNTYALPPAGQEIPYYQFFFYLNAGLYKVFSFFFRNFPLNKFLFYIPLFYAVIYLSILYFFCRYLFSDLAAFFSTLFIGLNGIFLIRSCAGWFDYEILALIFSLVIIWLLIIGLKERRRIKRLVFYSFFASLFMGLYVYTWPGWWFIFFVVAGAFLFGLINSFLINHREEREIFKKEALGYLVSGGVFLAGTIIFSFIFCRINLISVVYSQVKSNLNLGTPFISSIWPNTYYTVGELARVSPHAIGRALYGWIPLTFSLFGWGWIYIKKRRGELKDFLNIMFFLICFTIFATLKARRFIVFLSLPLGIFFGGFIEEVKEAVRKELKFHFKRAVTILVVFLISIFLVGSVFFAKEFRTASSIYPFMNDAWQRALSNIKKNTPAEAVINSWWDFGAMFQDVAERRVIFDGQSQNNPVAYWMARVFLSKSEEKARRILRMLNNASYKTFDLLNRGIRDPFRCIAILDRLLGLKREEAEDILKKERISPGLIGEILDDLYRRPPPAYFIVDGTMPSKMYQISFLGNWDFKKLYALRNIDKTKKEVIQGLKSIFTLSDEKSKGIYREVASVSKGRRNEFLSRRLQFYSSLAAGVRKENTVYFSNGLIFDLVSKKMHFFSYAQGRSEYRVPKSAFIFKNGWLEKINFKDASSGISVLVIIEGERYNAIFLSEDFGESLFARLYFVRGALKFFKPFYLDNSANIYVYRINWEKLDD